MKYTQEQIEEKLQKLPQALRDILFSPAIADKIFDIGNNNDLTIEQVGVLGEETGNIILGFTRPEDFAKVLQETLQIPESDGKKIAGEINQAVLVPLRDLLKSAHGIEVKGEDGMTPKGTPVFMQKPVVSGVEPPSSPPPEFKPEWIIKPELKQPRPNPPKFSEENLGGPPKVVLPEKEIQIPLPTSKPVPTPETTPITPIPLPDLPLRPAQPVIDLKNTAPPKLPENTLTSKVPPIDLRDQARSIPPEPPPVAIKTEPPPAPKPTPTPQPPKAIPDKGTDPYREPLD